MVQKAAVATYYCSQNHAGAKMSEAGLIQLRLEVCLFILFYFIYESKLGRERVNKAEYNDFIIICLAALG